MYKCSYNLILNTNRIIQESKTINEYFTKNIAQNNFLEKSFLFCVFQYN